MNYNQLLGVANDASKPEIQQAFRKAALETHPDHSNSPEAAQAFVNIKRARDELMKQADRRSTAEDIQSSTASAIASTTTAAYSTQADDNLFDGFTPEEIQYIQELDRQVISRPRRSLFRNHKESSEVIKHRKKIQTNNKRLQGLY